MTISARICGPPAWIASPHSARRHNSHQSLCLEADNAAVSKDNVAALDKINEIIAGIDDDQRQDMWSACMDRQPA